MSRFAGRARTLVRLSFDNTVAAGRHQGCGVGMMRSAPQDTTDVYCCWRSRPYGGSARTLHCLLGVVAQHGADVAARGVAAVAINERVSMSVRCWQRDNGNTGALFTRPLFFGHMRGAVQLSVIGALPLVGALHAYAAVSIRLRRRVQVEAALQWIVATMFTVTLCQALMAIICRRRAMLLKQQHGITSRWLA